MTRRLLAVTLAFLLALGSVPAQAGGVVTGSIKAGGVQGGQAGAVHLNGGVTAIPALSLTASLTPSLATTLSAPALAPQLTPAGFAAAELIAAPALNAPHAAPAASAAPLLAP